MHEEMHRRQDGYRVNEPVRRVHLAVPSCAIMPSVEVAPSTHNPQKRNEADDKIDPHYDFGRDMRQIEC